MPPIPPELIELILEVLLPMLLACLENRSKQDIAAMLSKPNRRQRFVLLFALPRRARKALRSWWKQVEQDHELAIDDELVDELRDVGTGLAQLHTGILVLR